MRCASPTTPPDLVGYNRTMTMVAPKVSRYLIEMINKISKYVCSLPLATLSGMNHHRQVEGGALSPSSEELLLKATEPFMAPKSTNININININTPLIRRRFAL
jgi:hypothetical protein